MQPASHDYYGPFTCSRHSNTAHLNWLHVCSNLYVLLIHTHSMQATVIEEHLLVMTQIPMRKRNYKKQYREACHMTKPPHPPLQLLPLLMTVTTMKTCNELWNKALLTCNTAILLILTLHLLIIQHTTHKRSELVRGQLPVIFLKQRQ